MNVYVSTSAIKNPFQLDTVLAKYKENNIKFVELGSSHKYQSNIEEIIKQNKQMEFLVHNYFPPHENPFALNLSSINEDIRFKSIKHAKRAIDLCKEIGSPIYSIHAGMITNPNRIEFFEGFSFDKITISESMYLEAFEKLINSCREINRYAKEKGICFAIENSGGHPSKYPYLLMTKQKEFSLLLKEINDSNFGILLDIGHYNVTTSVYEGEKITNFIDEFSKHIYQVHVHHNDGTNDQHLPPTDHELKLIRRFGPATKIVLESMKNEIDQIIYSLNRIKGILDY
ncbi:sugar phosphate isomerase/epimerase family protein [Bacillus sp. AK128]